MLYLKKDFIDKNPNTTQALVNALYKALKWIEKASPEEIAAAVPEEYLLGDKALYIARREELEADLLAERHRRAPPA